MTAAKRQCFRASQSKAEPLQQAPAAAPPPQPTKQKTEPNAPSSHGRLAQAHAEMRAELRGVASKDTTAPPAVASHSNGASSSSVAALELEASKLDNTIKAVESTLRRKRELDEQRAQKAKEEQNRLQEETVAAKKAKDQLFLDPRTRNMAAPLPPSLRRTSSAEVAPAVNASKQDGNTMFFDPKAVVARSTSRTATTAAASVTAAPMAGSALLARARTLARSGQHEESLRVFKAARAVLEARGVRLESKPILTARIAALEKLVQDKHQSSRQQAAKTKQAETVAEVAAAPSKALTSSDSDSDDGSDSDNDGAADKDVNGYTADAEKAAEREAFGGPVAVRAAVVDGESSPFAKRLKAAVAQRLTTRGAYPPSSSSSSINRLGVNMRFTEADKLAGCELLETPATDRAAAANSVGGQRWAAMTWVERLALVKEKIAAQQTERQAKFDRVIFRHGRRELAAAVGTPPPPPANPHHAPAAAEAEGKVAAGGRCAICTLPAPCGKVHAGSKRTWAAVVAGGRRAADPQSAAAECGSSQAASVRAWQIRQATVAAAAAHQVLARPAEGRNAEMRRWSTAAGLTAARPLAPPTWCAPHRASVPPHSPNEW